MNPTNVHYCIISEKMDKSIKELSDLFERGVRDYIVQLHPLELAKNHSRGTPEFEVRSAPTHEPNTPRWITIRWCAK